MRTDIVKTAIVDDILYVLEKEPYDISEVITENINRVFVPELSVDGYKEINTEYSDKIYPYGYSSVKLTKEPFYDQIAVIMTTESNAPMMSVMYSRGLCANPDYMTLEEAKAVRNEDCANLLDGNSEVTSFNEFQYFTNVTDCGSYFARNAFYLESIVFPKSLKVIPPRMFTITNANYKSGKRGHLKYVGNCEQIESVGQVAFQNQNLVKRLNFTQKLTEIQPSAFLCPNKQTMGDNWKGGEFETFGDLSAVESVSGAAFWCDVEIKSIYMPKVTVINDHTFYECFKLSDVTFDWNNLTSIGVAAFENTVIKNLPNLPKLTEMKQSAFQKDEALEYIGNMPLLTTLGTYAFWHCVNLKEVGDMPLITTIGIYTFADDKELYKVGKLDSLTTINEGGFAGCNKLSYIYLPVANNVGKYAFAVDEGLGVNRKIEFGLPYESITFNNQAFVNNVNTRIICNGVELTDEQYQAVGAVKPNNN